MDLDDSYLISSTRRDEHITHLRVTTMTGFPMSNEYLTKRLDSAVSSINWAESEMTYHRWDPMPPRR